MDGIDVRAHLRSIARAVHHRQLGDAVRLSPMIWVACAAIAATACSTSMTPDVPITIDAPTEIAFDALGSDAAVSDLAPMRDSSTDAAERDVDPGPDAITDAPGDLGVEAAMRDSGPDSAMRADASFRCLPPAPTSDLAVLIAMAPVALVGGTARMMPVDRASAAWLAARDAAIAWSAGDCTRFATAATPRWNSPMPPPGVTGFSSNAAGVSTTGSSPSAHPINSPRRERW